jgi:hypothetical protein
VTCVGGVRRRGFRRDALAARRALFSSESAELKVRRETRCVELFSRISRRTLSRVNHAGSSTESPSRPAPIYPEGSIGGRGGPEGSDAREARARFVRYSSQRTLHTSSSRGTHSRSTLALATRERGDQARSRCELAPLWWTSRKGLLSWEFRQCNKERDDQNHSRRTPFVA